MLAALALAFALAADATAVALTRGLAGYRNERLLVPTLFGVFQAAMAGLGLVAGHFVTVHLGHLHRYIGAGLLLVLGSRMMLRWFASSEESESDATASPSAVPPPSRTHYLELVGLAIATSIDAALAGTSLPAFATPPAIALALIGIVTAALAAGAFAVGLQLREHLPARLGVYVETSGGAILVGLAAKIALLS